jgi:anion-transporting  ArsA/GET3 family ATPase
MKDFINKAPRFVFFTGKGGVGKTSMSCVAVAALADRGKRVLLISTDPATHLTHLLVEPVPNLQVSRIDPKEESRKYVAAVIEQKRRLLSDDDMELKYIGEVLTKNDDRVVMAPWLSNEILSADLMASLFHPQH